MATSVVPPFPREPLRNANYQFEMPLRTPYELGMFLRAAFGVSMPDTRICPNHSTPWEAFCAAYFAWSPVIVVKASRGFGGKSFWNAVLALTEAITLGADVNLLGGSGAQSTNIHDSLRQLWHHPSAPRHLGQSDIVRETRLVNGAKIKALLASHTSVRGPHPQRLRLDEIDEMDMKLLDAATGQAQSGRGVLSQTSMSSTHQHDRGTMSAILARAADMGWPTHEWCFRETVEPHGWLPPSEVDRKRDGVSKAMFAIEYELQAPNPGDRAFDPDAVTRAFNRELGEWAGEDREVIELERFAGDGGTFATGADWARKIDKTAITTLRVDEDPMPVCAFQRFNRLLWPHTLERFHSQVNRWSGQRKWVCHDAVGIGDWVEGGYAEVDVEGLILQGRKRRDFFSEYIHAIESGEIVWPMIRSAYVEHSECAYDDLFGKGHPPDTVVSGAMAYRAAKTLQEGAGAIGVPQSVDRRSPWKIE